MSFNFHQWDIDLLTAMLVIQQLKQIGNAVPVPLSRALGKELGKAVIKMWEAEDRARESGSLEL